MEFPVEFEINIPGGTPESEVEDRENAEASAAVRLAGRRASRSGREAGHPVAGQAA